MKPLTPEQRAAWQHLRACVRQFLRCADEFPDDPAASAEWYEAMEAAQARLDRAWEVGELPRADLLYPELPMSPIVPAPAWVPWPTSTGFWWARERPGAPLCVVEARVEPESSWIYFTGVEGPLYANEPWEFTPVSPPKG